MILGENIKFRGGLLGFRVAAACLVKTADGKCSKSLLLLVLKVTTACVFYYC